MMVMSHHHSLMTACSSNFLALAAEALLVKRCVGRYLAPGSEEEEGLVIGGILCEGRYLAPGSEGVVENWGAKAVYHLAPSMPLICFYFFWFFWVRHSLSKSRARARALSLSLTHTRSRQVCYKGPVCVL